MHLPDSQNPPPASGPADGPEQPALAVPSVAGPSGPATSQGGVLPADAIVSCTGSLVFLTTGQRACDLFGQSPAQLALTPVVALRIAEVLRVIIQYPDLASRSAIVEEWQAGELPHVPHGRLLIDTTAAWVGIEPIGAGVLVGVLWEHVPALVVHLEHYAGRLRQR